MITKEQKQSIIAEYGRSEGDTGSPEVQISYRAYEEKSERFPFQQRTFEDGRCKKKPSRLSEEERY